MTKVYTKNITPVQRKLVRDLIPFCAKKLMPRIKDLQITVIGVKDLVENEGIHADVIYEYVDAIVRPKDYIIRVDTMEDLQEFVRVICHEMVHVKQYIRNELGINDNHDGQNYFNLPYEKEAYKLQEILLKQFKEVYNYEMA